VFFIFFCYLVFFVSVQCYTQEHIQTFRFLFCVIVRSALGRRRLPSFFPASGRCKTVMLPSVDVDCCVPATPSLDNKNTACRTHCRCGSDSVHRWRSLPLRTDWLSDRAGSEYQAGTKQNTEVNERGTFPKNFVQIRPRFI